MAVSEKEEFFESFDGTRIAYQTFGDGPAMVLANGLGGRWMAWKFLIEHYAPRCRLIAWDYRGLYHSGLPPHRGSVGVHHHARDLELLLAHLSIKQAIFVGWSMGVQVNFELYRTRPDLYRAMIALNGTYGQAYHAAAGFPLARYVIPLVFELVRRQAPHASKAMSWVTAQPLFFRLMRSVGWVAKSCAQDVFVEMARSYGDMDLGVYCDIMDQLGVHNAWDILQQIRCPVLIIAGGRDFFTPLAIATKIHEQIPGAELHIIPRASHYASIEHPDEIQRLVDDFLTRRAV